LLDDSTFVCDEQQTKHDEFVTLALEAIRNPSSHGDLFSVASSAPVYQIASRVNPRAELVVAHQDLICETKEREWVCNRSLAEVDWQALGEIFKHF
jgi:hypothetical protein